MKVVMVGIVVVLTASSSVELPGRPTGREHINSLGMEFVRVEPGTFKMGYGDR